MVDSGALSPTQAVGCESELGAYHLARDYVKVTVSKKDVAFSSVASNWRIEVAAEPVPRPDTRRGYCLDFLSTPFARDIVRVVRNDGMLVEVSTVIKTSGQVKAASYEGTQYLTDEIIDGAFRSISGKTQEEVLTGSPLATTYRKLGGYRIPSRPAFGAFLTTEDAKAGLAAQNPEGKELKSEPLKPSHEERTSPTPNTLGYQPDRSLLDIEYDPADPHEAAAANLGLKAYGYCLILNDGKVDPRDSAGYCKDPVAFVRRRLGRPPGKSAPQETEYIKASGGILYQPRRRHELYIFRKGNLAASGGWVLHKQQSIALVNRAPVMAVAVDRTAFADRNTTLTFTKGALQSVRIDKDSELLGASKIVFAMVESIVLLPTAMLQLRFRNETNMGELLTKNKELLDTRRVTLGVRKEVADLEKAQAGNSGGPDKNAVQAYEEAKKKCNLIEDPFIRKECLADAAKDAGL